VYAPGCTPGPETLMHAILTLHDQITSGEITRRRGETGAGANIQVLQQDGQRASGVVIRR